MKQVIPRPLVRALRTARILETSEAGESALLKKLAKKYAVERWIVDVGANDGVTYSNSFAFAKAGWRALLVEPAPAAFRKLAATHRARANVTCIEAACSETPGQAQLYFGADGEDGMLSTLCLDENEWYRKVRTTVSTTVAVTTITAVLTNASAPARPGILLVDCEGMDYEALRGLDFARYRPTVIVTEEYELDAQKHANKYSLLIRNNYSLVQKLGSNTVWLDRTAESLH